MLKETYQYGPTNLKILKNLTKSSNNSNVWTIKIGDWNTLFQYPGGDCLTIRGICQTFINFPV